MEDRRRNHDSGSITWGILLIFVGVVYFLINAGLIPREVWTVIGGFWPVILILIGVQVILGHGTVQKVLMGIITTVILALILIAALDKVGSPLVSGFSILKNINLNR